MGLWLPLFGGPMGAPVKVWTLASAAIGLLAQGATAGTLVHLKKTVWGCVDPNVTPTINDETNPVHWDPRWLARTSEEGHCVIIGPKSPWEPLSPDYHGLTYVAYRGTTGKPGSFWVPTAAIGASPPVQAAPPAPPTITREPLPPPGLPPLPKANDAAQEASPAAPEQTVASEPPVSPMAEPSPAPTPPKAKDAAQEASPAAAEQTAASEPPVSPTAEPPVATAPSSSPSNGSADGWGAFGHGALPILALLAVAWLARRSRGRRAPGEGRAKPAEARMQAPDVSVRIHPSSLAQSQARPASQEPMSPARADEDPAMATVRAGSFHLKPRSTNRGGQTVRQAPDVSFRIHPSSLVQPPARPVSRGQVAAARADEDPAKIGVRAESFHNNPRFTNREGQPTKSPSSKPTFIWYPRGKAVAVADATVMDGMIYVGRASGSWGEHDASVIDPALPVASTSISAGALGYWPSYRALTPECRRRYLQWLASGKRDPDADIGYVFLYFYGLERRLLIDSPAPDEVRALVAELDRLRAIYAGNRSFDGYSRRLIEAVAFLQNAAAVSESQFIPDLAAPWGDMPLALKVVVAREVLAGRPLRFEFAAAALLGLSEFCSAHRHVLDKSRAAFLTVLRSRFEATFRSGFLLQNRKNSHLQLIYRGASAGLAIDLAERAGLKDLPDPETLTWTKLLAVAGAAAQEIAPYAKALAYQPARANSLHGLVECPAELRDAIAPEARRWLEGLPSPAAVPFGELAGHAIGTATAKWTLRHRRQVSEALAVLGHAVEPDPEDGTEHLEDDTLVQVFRCADRARSRAMDVARAAAVLVAIVGRTVDGGADKAAEFWLSRVPSRLSLTSDQATRLRALLAWLATRNVTLAKARRQLGDATPEEREFCAWSATVAAGATGTVGKPQIALLEAIHDDLAVPRSALYAGLHAGIGAAALAAAEPVIVSGEVQETLHPISPRPEIERTEGDSDRLARIRADTDRVAAILADIFVDEESPLEAPESTGEGPLAGLDAEHTVLLTRLVARPEWSREEFESAASEAGLMPGGAMETINEWAFDRYGDALLEDDNPIVVNRKLLLVDPETVAPSDIPSGHSGPTILEPIIRCQL